MKETPVSILCKQINFYRGFIERLKGKEGIDKDAPQEKLDKLISECEEKIKEFETAIKILDPNAKCTIHPTLKSGASFHGNTVEKAVTTILLANAMFKGAK